MCFDFILIAATDSNILFLCKMGVGVGGLFFLSHVVLRLMF